MNLRLATFASCLTLSLGAAHAGESAPRPAATTLTSPKGESQSVDARGFIHRWLVLEPIPVQGRLTESAVQEALKIGTLPDVVGTDPRHGVRVTVNGTEHTWHALDTLNYNFNLYHFAWSHSKPTSNVLFWIETTVEAPREMRDVRLAIGSNAASRWWLNGDLVIALNDDRQSVIDDGVSKRITLRPGRNVIRAAVINGGGATDFCARFLHEDGTPVQGLKVSLASGPDPRG